MKKREPDFENIKKVLAREKTGRAVLFELFMNMPLYEYLTGSSLPKDADDLTILKKTVDGFAAAGYDYATTHASDFRFYQYKETDKASRSLNDISLIKDWESFEAFQWSNPEDFSNSKLDKINSYLPGNMKLLIMGPGGVLENLEDLMGYDNLCMALYDEPELVKEVTDNIGRRLLIYYESVLQHESVGFVCSNDDWGFNTQTLLSPDDLRKYIFPWHKRIVELAHRYNKPCILHSCGYFKDIIDDVIYDMGFDARHSYEDNIMPVEEAYEKYGSQIAILGGIDLNFVCRETPENIYRRSREMLEHTFERGGYALGTGNSVPEYVPYENYMAMIRAAWEFTD